MKRVNLNFLVDLLAFGCFLFLTTTGVLVHYILPESSGYFRQIWGLDRHQWGAVHFWIAVVFLLVLTLHLALHWRWLSSTSKSHAAHYSGLKMALGAVALLALMAIAIAPLVSPVVDYQESINIEIRGSMSLQALSDASGVPVAYLLETLSLPKNTSTQTRLGILKNSHDFHMSDVKKAIVRYRQQQERR